MKVAYQALIKGLTSRSCSQAHKICATKGQVRENPEDEFACKSSSSTTGIKEETLDPEEEFSELAGQESSPEDRWLTDAEYGGGRWYRFSWERMLAMLLSTRFTTAMLEFIARAAGLRIYVPVWVKEPLQVNTNVDWDNPDSIRILYDADDNLILLRDGRPMWHQGMDFVPKALAKSKKVKGKRLWFAGNFFKLPNLGRKDRDGTDLLTPAQTRDLKRRIKRAQYLGPADMVWVRYWVLTNNLDDTLQQCPRKPYDMIPKWDLNDELAKENALRDTAKTNYKMLVAAHVGSGLKPHELPFPDSDYGEYQFRGFVPRLEEQFIRAVRLKLKGADLPPFMRIIDGKYTIHRFVENINGRAMRAHRTCYRRYITAKQVWDGFEETKRRAALATTPDPYPEDPIGLLAGNYTLPLPAGVTIEKEVRRLLIAMRDSGQVSEAAELQKQIRVAQEKWIARHYDRYLPNEQYERREIYNDLYALHGNDWASKADMWFSLVQLRFNVRLPYVYGKNPGDQRRGALIVTNSAPRKAAVLGSVDVDSPDFESLRNEQHMVDHWKYSKGFDNTVRAFNADKGAPQRARQSDAGGWVNPDAAETYWLFMVSHEAAPKSKPALRRVIVGPAWYDKEPWQDIDHDGSLIEKFYVKKVGWVSSCGQLKELSSKAGRGRFPTRKDGKLDDLISEHRDYPNELQLLLLDEYYARDSVDAFRNQKGIVIFSILDDVNARLKPRFKLYPNVVLNYDNCCGFGSFIELMSECLPAAPLVRNIEGAMKGWKTRNVRHFRPEIDKMIDGVHRNREIQQEVERWYRESDERYWEYVYYDSENMSTLTEPSAAGGFSINDAVKACEVGFGTGYGPVEMWQSRQEALMEVGLYTGYFSAIKGVLEWWSVRVTATRIFDEKSWPDINDLKLKVAGLLESRKLIYIVAEQLLWPQLHIKKLIPSSEPFPIRIPEVDFIDRTFVYEMLNTRAGTDYVPTAEEAELNPTFRKLRDEIVQKNQERYNRIAIGRFFEINQ